MSRTLRGLGTGNGDCVLEIAEVGKIKYKVKTQALMKTKACVFVLDLCYNKEKGKRNDKYSYL